MSNDRGQSAGLLHSNNRKINSNVVLFGWVQQVDAKENGDSSPEGQIQLKDNHVTCINPLTPSQSSF